MHPATAVLVHSPFLGPASLRPLADALAGHGHPAVLLDLRPSVVAPPVHQVLVGAFADAIGDASLSGPIVLVGHSGAGPLLPAFADALDDVVSGLIFLDAGLPTPGRAWRDTVPASLYTELRDRSRDGLLPRWHLWFEPDPLRDLDPALRAEMIDEAPEVPLAFLKEARPDVEWTGPAGYVLLSPAYTEDFAAARASGWPVATLDSHHLAPTADPEPVAEAIVRVLSAMTA